MKKRRIITALALALAVACTFMHASGAAGMGNTAYEADVLYQVNEVRLRRGLNPLSTFSDLNKVSSIRAEELISVQSHKRPNGKSCFSALDEYRIGYYAAAENIAFGYKTPNDLVTALFNSQAHRGNLLEKDFAHMGVGYRNTPQRPEHYWVQMFVGGCSIKSISVEPAAPYIAFSKGTSIQAIADSRKYKVVGRCDMHGEFSLPLSASMCSGYSASYVGTQEITVKCFGKTAKADIRLVNGVMGDANGNSRLDAGDATLILRYVIGVIDKNGLNAKFADINGNGIIDSGDASAVLQAII